MIDILVLVATNFEDTELISAVNIFKRNSISYDLVSIENKDTVKGQNEAIVKTKKIEKIKSKNYKSIFLPGGKGHKLMLESKDVLNIVREFKDKYLFAICAAPSVFLKAGVINGLFTSYPGFALDSKNTGNSIEITSKMVTAKNFVDTIQFANAVANKLKEKTI